MSIQTFPSWIKDYDNLKRYLDHQMFYSSEVLQYVNMEDVSSFERGTKQFIYWKGELAPSLVPNTVIFSLLGPQGLKLPNVMLACEALNSICDMSYMVEVFQGAHSAFLGISFTKPGEAEKMRESFLIFDDSLVVYVPSVLNKDFEFRLQWLPPMFPEENVRRLLDCYTASYSIHKETVQTGAYRFTPTNVVRGVLTPKADSSISDLPHLVKLPAPHRGCALLTIFGRQHLCLKCREIGHLRRECPLQKCGKCLKVHLPSAVCGSNAYAAIASKNVLKPKFNSWLDFTDDSSSFVPFSQRGDSPVQVASSIDVPVKGLAELSVIRHEGCGYNSLHAMRDPATNGTVGVTSGDALCSASVSTTCSQTSFDSTSESRSGLLKSAVSFGSVPLSKSLLLLPDSSETSMCSHSPAISHHDFRTSRGDTFQPPTLVQSIEPPTHFVGDLEDLDMETDFQIVTRRVTRSMGRKASAHKRGAPSSVQGETLLTSNVYDELQDELCLETSREMESSSSVFNIDEESQPKGPVCTDAMLEANMGTASTHDSSECDRKRAKILANGEEFEMTGYKVILQELIKDSLEEVDKSNIEMKGDQASVQKVGRSQNLQVIDCLDDLTPLALGVGAGALLVPESHGSFEHGVDISDSMVSDKDSVSESLNSFFICLDGFPITSTTADALNFLGNPAYDELFSIIDDNSEDTGSYEISFCSREIAESFLTLNGSLYEDHPISIALM